jgi:hypothetical protein
MKYYVLTESEVDRRKAHNTEQAAINEALSYVIAGDTGPYFIAHLSGEVIPGTPVYRAYESKEPATVVAKPVKKRSVARVRRRQ